MTLYHHEQIFRAHPAGTGINGVDITAYRHADDSIIAGPVATSTIDNVVGKVQLYLADTATTGQSAYELHPGPYYTQGTYNGVTRTWSSETHGGSGALHMIAQMLFNRAMGDGIIQKPPFGLDEFEASATGSDMNVTITSGAGCIAGIPFFNDVPRSIVVPTQNDLYIKTSTIVLEMVPVGNAEAGKLTLKLIEGGINPPVLQNDATLVQIPICDVQVHNSASTIEPESIIDRRPLIERSTTALEGDVAALEARVDDLEALVVPREEIVATYVATYDPPNLPVGTWTPFVTLNSNQFSFHNGHAALDKTMIVRATHSTTSVPLLAQVANTTGDLVTVTAVNPWSTVNPASGTLTIVITKLVTS